MQEEGTAEAALGYDCFSMKSAAFSTSNAAFIALLWLRGLAALEVIS